MTHLRVQALGGLTVSAATSGVVPIPTSCRPILGYLIAHRRRGISRAELAETLWGEHDGRHARRCLSTALWRLKASTRPCPPLLSFYGTEEISLDWAGPIWVDSIALEMRAQPLLRIAPHALKRADIGRLERGVRLYRGDFLQGIDDEWAALERQRLRNLYLDSLHHLMVAHADASNWAAALDWGRRLNREEPLREDVHRLLMRVYVHTGNRAKAAAQYRQCERILESELGVEPMPETQELHRQLMQSNGREPTMAARSGAPAPRTINRGIVHSRRAPATDRRALGRVCAAPAKTSPAPNVE